MRLRLLRRGEIVFNPDDPELSAIATVLWSIGYRASYEVVHAHTGVNAGCECNLIRGEE